MTDKRKYLFNLKYPNIIFENLKQSLYETDDSSTHYLDIKTNIVYSYNYQGEYWYNKIINSDLHKLFYYPW
jgi:hypothetical protein